MTAYLDGQLVIADDLLVTGDVKLLGGGNIETVDNNDLTLLPNGTGITIIGDAGSTSHSLAANDDLFISGKLEIDGTVYFDSTSFFFGSPTFYNPMYLGSGSNVAFYVNGPDDDFVLGVGSDYGRMLVLTDTANFLKSHDHATQTNPTIFGHSATDPDSDNTEWWSLTHDQTDAVLGVGKGDLLLTTPANKTLVLSQSVYDDLRVSLYGQLASGLKPPAWTKVNDDGAGSVGLYAWAFGDEGSAVNEEQMWFAAQLPHGYKEGTDVEAHIHWCLLAGGAAGEFVKWGLEYVWINPDGAIGNSTIITSDASAAATATTSEDGTLVADKHYVTNIGDISGAGKTISSMLMCRIFRNSSDATDDLAQDAIAHEVDFHFEIDTMGSREEDAK